MSGAIWSFPSLMICFAVFRKPTACRMALSLFSEGRSGNCSAIPTLYSLAACIPATSCRSFST